jgi:hypothetical protein
MRRSKHIQNLIEDLQDLHERQSTTLPHPLREGLSLKKLHGEVDGIASLPLIDDSHRTRMPNRGGCRSLAKKALFDIPPQTHFGMEELDGGPPTFAILSTVYRRHSPHAEQAPQPPATADDLTQTSSKMVLVQLHQRLLTTIPIDLRANLHRPKVRATP